ncbi:MAG: hypothetical protein A2231_10570 [Candidatus Firestonebacteria bacterium RIFOXYA2_FULL_40_8]|nr:MAG: hypothetical protein A2231_10570 [Candidatus Firestonebacteria bacterium RIFOXYA2_FULL_40_8]
MLFLIRISTFIFIVLACFFCKDIYLVNNEIYFRDSSGKENKITRELYSEYSIYLSPDKSKAVYLSQDKKLTIVDSKDNKVIKRVSINLGVFLVEKVFWISDNIVGIMGENKENINYIKESTFLIVDIREEKEIYSLKGDILVTPDFKYVFFRADSARYLPEEQQFQRLGILRLYKIKEMEYFKVDYLMFSFPENLRNEIYELEKRPYIVSDISWNENESAIAFVTRYYSADKSGVSCKYYLNIQNIGNESKISTLSIDLNETSDWDKIEIVNVYFNDNSTVTVKYKVKEKQKNSKDINVSLYFAKINIKKSTIEKGKTGTSINQNVLARKYGSDIANKIIKEMIGADMSENKYENIIEREDKIKNEIFKDKPIITFKENVLNFGKVKEGETVEKEFEYKNTGGSELLITGFKYNTNYISVVNTTNVPKRNGQVGILQVTIKTKDINLISELYIVVKSNDEKNPLYKLKVNVEIVKPDK